MMRMKDKEEKCIWDASVLFAKYDCHEKQAHVTS
jgi:hypothetical protein